MASYSFAAEIAATGAVVAIQAVWVSYGKEAPDEPASWKMEHIATLLIPSIALVVGGVSVVAGAGGGLYWVLAAVLLAFVSAATNAWVLLVSIKR